MNIVEKFFANSARRGLIVDTNLWILYFVGATGEHRVGKDDFTSDYTLEDFKLLSRILQDQRRLITTPHILAELSNQLKFKGDLRDEFLSLFEHQVQLLDERHCEGKRICASPAFRDLGITDTGITLLADEGPSIITADLDLYSCLVRAKASVLNFNHFRVGALYGHV